MDSRAKLYFQQNDQWSVCINWKISFMNIWSFSILGLLKIYIHTAWKMDRFSVVVELKLLKYAKLPFQCIPALWCRIFKGKEDFPAIQIHMKTYRKLLIKFWHLHRHYSAVEKVEIEIKFQVTNWQHTANRWCCAKSSITNCPGELPAR